MLVSRSVGLWVCGAVICDPRSVYCDLLSLPQILLGPDGQAGADQQDDAEDCLPRYDLLVEEMVGNAEHEGRLDEDDEGR